MRRALAALLVVSVAGGCRPPVETGAAVAAAAPAPPAASQPAELPGAVQARVKQLRAIAETGSYRDMAKLASENSAFRSNDGGWKHSAYWYLKLRTGDWPMEQMKTVLSYPPAVMRTDQGLVYVWPYMAVLAPDAVSLSAVRDIDALAGAGQGEAMRAGARYPGYSLGVREDGTWLFFVSGAG